jgi:microcystin-dependent protein
MASTFSANLNLELQGTGEHSGTWGTTLNTLALAIVDDAMGGTQTLTLSSIPVTISTAQSQKNLYKLTGLLTGNVTITWPAIGRTYFIINNTTGGFTVTLACAGGGSTATIPQGSNGFIVLDGTNVIAQSSTGVPVGQLGTFAMTVVPTNWLECDGSAVSRSTYSALFAAIGTVFGAGNGSSTFNLPDMRGNFARGWDHGAGVDPARVFGSLQGSANLAHTHVFVGAAMAPHTHGMVRQHSHGTGQQFQMKWSDGNDPATSDTIQINVNSVSAGTPAGTNSSVGGTESRPVNVAMMICIKAL